MDAIGETIENVGLAQEINNGLAKSLTKPPKWAEMAEGIEAKKGEVGAMDPWAVYQMPLGKFCITEWAKKSGIDLSVARRRSSAGAVNAAKPPPARCAAVQSPAEQWCTVSLALVAHTANVTFPRSPHRCLQPSWCCGQLQ